MRKPVITVFLFTLVLFLGIYFRLYPATHNQRLAELSRAKLIAYVTIDKDIRKQVENKYPALPEEEKKTLQAKLLSQVLLKGGKQINALVKNISAENKSDPFKETYLLEADPYYYLGLTNNILESGNIGKERRGIKYFNPLMMAPDGYWYNFDLHPYVGFYIFKLLGLIKKDISPELSAAITPLILFIPAVFMVLCLYKVLRLKPISIWLGLIYFACLPILIIRGSFGWYDTDIYNVIFPLLVITVLTRSLGSGITLKSAIGLNILAAFFTALYSLFWRGWIYLPFFVILAYLAVIFFNVLRRPSMQNKPLNACFAVYLSASVFFSILFIGITGVREVFSESLLLVLSFFSVKAQIWPDIYITVGELHRAVFSEIIGLLGGAFAALLVLAGFFHRIMLFFTRKDDINERDKTLFLCVASISLFIFSISAQRFLLFSCVPFLIFFAFGIEAVIGIADTLKDKMPSLFAKRCFSAAIAVLLCLLMLPELVLAHTNAAQQFPIMNKCWKEALLKIRDSTPADAIVNSWWCPGHFITAVSKRRVTFDGATQEAPREYWAANAFLSEDESRSLGIWRMLNTSGNAAFDFLTENKKYKPSEAVKILNSILPLDRQKAMLSLSGLMPQEEANSLLGLTHGNPPPSYCLIYDNLIETIIALRYSGNWDFKKIEDFNELKRMHGPEAKINMKRGSPEYRDFLWSISGGPAYIGEESSEVERKGKTVFFGNGVSLNTENMDCSVYFPEKNISARPMSVFYMDGDVFKEKKLDNPTANISVLLIDTADKLSCLIADRQFAASLLLRLYYLKGRGLKFFRNFYSVEDPLTQTRICVYKMEDITGPSYKGTP